jgi:hypothetical protein
MMNQTQTLLNRDFAIDYDLMNFIDDTVKAAVQDEIQEMVAQSLIPKNRIWSLA